MRWWHAAAGVGGLVLFARMAGGPDSRVQRMARAIARAEGFGVPGAIPTVRHNPGNIRMLSAPFDIATYESDADGWAALYRQVSLMLYGGSRVYSPDMPLSEVARLYTGEARYMDWAWNVARVLGVTPDTPFAEAV